MKAQEIIFVTTNKGKIAYANRLLPNTNVIPYEADLIEPRGDDVKVIAQEKVKQAYEKTKKPCIAMDIGFYIRALNGFPRAYVNLALDTIGIEGILKLMTGIQDRHCEFRECVAYYDGIKMYTFESAESAAIADSICGTKNENKLSDLWYIVIPHGFNKTLAQFSDDDFSAMKQNQGDSSLSLFGKWYEKHFT